MSSQIFTTPRTPRVKQRPPSNRSVRSVTTNRTETPIADVMNLSICYLCANEMNRPKHLPCIHSFCESCIEKYVQQLKEKKTSTNVPCPVCDMPAATISHLSPKEFAENLPTSTLISTVMSRKCAASPSCGRCKSHGRESKATSWCGYCAQALCEEHVEYHLELTTTKVQHPIVKLKEMLTPGNFEFVRKCKFHTNEEMTHFCKDESAPCCPICAKVMHKHCNVTRLQQIAYNIKMDPSTMRLRSTVDALETETNKLFIGRQKNIDHLNEQLQTERKRLREFREKLNEHLDSLEDTLAEEIETFHKQKNQELEKEAKLFKSKNSTLNYYKKLLDSIQENSGNFQAVQELASIRTQTKLIENDIKVTLSKLKWTEFTLNYPYDLVKSITRLGSVQQNIKNIGRTETSRPSTRS